MASWWSLIAQQVGATNATKGSHPHRAATALGATNQASGSWEGRVAQKRGLLSSNGSWTKRGAAKADLVGKSGSAGRLLYNALKAGH